MNHWKRMSVWAVLLGAAMVAVGAGATRRGTSVLHYMTRHNLEATPAGAGVTGTLRLQLNEQGRAALQKFDLKAAGLGADTEYFLIAVIGDDTNAWPVATVQTDNKGKLRVSYMKKGQGNGNPKKVMPEALDPLTDLRGVGLATLAETQALAFAWMNASQNYQYLVKRNLTPADENGTAAGSISLKANANTVTFRLLADGLNASDTYHLALNSNVVESVTSDSSGALQISNWPASAPAVLDLRSLALLDVGSNVVLHTVLPK